MSKSSLLTIFLVAFAIISPRIAALVFLILIVAVSIITLILLINHIIAELLREDSWVMIIDKKWK